MSSADAGSNRSHSSPFVSGTGMYGVINICANGKLDKFAGKIRSAWTAC